MAQYSDDILIALMLLADRDLHMRDIDGMGANANALTMWDFGLIAITEGGFSSVVSQQWSLMHITNYGRFVLQQHGLGE